MIKLFIIKAFIATSCIVSPNPCGDVVYCSYVSVPAHIQTFDGTSNGNAQAFVNGKWVNAKVRVLIPIQYKQVCKRSGSTAKGYI